MKNDGNENERCKVLRKEKSLVTKTSDDSTTRPYGSRDKLSGSNYLICHKEKFSCSGQSKGIDDSLSHKRVI